MLPCDTSSYRSFLSFIAVCTLLTATSAWGMDPKFELDPKALDKKVLPTASPAPAVRPSEKPRHASVQGTTYTIKPGDNLLALDLAKVKRDLEMTPLIESASVERVFPHGLRILVFMASGRAGANRSMAATGSSPSMPNKPANGLPSRAALSARRKRPLYGSTRARTARSKRSANGRV